LGVAYKRDIDDIRESPALDIIRLLEGQGARVSYHDPHVPVLAEDGHGSLGAARSQTVAAADCIMIVTDRSAVDCHADPAEGRGWWWTLVTQCRRGMTCTWR
jgi:UDP-N-acetyl-D-glucosamine dehydrogenase